jgi:hypothetical protein
VVDGRPVADRRRPVWFKACAPGTSFEPGLVRRLADTGTTLVDAPLAVDEQRGWLLAADAGTVLRERMPTDRADVTDWLDVLPRYAELQRTTAAAADDLVRAGVPDTRLGRLPAAMAALLDDEAEMALMPRETYDRLREALDDIAADCARLDAFGILPGIQHDDLHDGNVLVAPDGTHSIIDWGDAAVAHPFSTMLVTLRSVRFRWELAEDAPELRRMRDAYLEPWTGEHSHAHLVEAVGLATRVGMVARALAWQRALAETAPADRGEHSEPVTGWLAELLV